MCYYRDTKTRGCTLNKPQPSRRLAMDTHSSCNRFDPPMMPGNWSLEDLEMIEEEAALFPHDYEEEEDEWYDQIVELKRLEGIYEAEIEEGQAILDQLEAEEGYRIYSEDYDSDLPQEVRVETELQRLENLYKEEIEEGQANFQEEEAELYELAGRFHEQIAEEQFFHDQMEAQRYRPFQGD